MLVVFSAVALETDSANAYLKNKLIAVMMMIL